MLSALQSHKTRIVTSILTISLAFGSSLPIAIAEYNSMLAPSKYTPPTYIPPKYDAFDHDYYYPPVNPEAQADTVPVADFNIYTDQQGLQNTNAGTLATIFTFNAVASTDNETDSSKLEARWDFESDSKVDSYFSLNKVITHQFKKAGIYSVKLEILDGAGNISSITKNVTVVANTSPSASFTYSPVDGTEKTIFHFDTSKSTSNQYLAYALQYRFDWNGDGKWDTKFEAKTGWNHMFNDANAHIVIMQAKDPAGQMGSATATITTHANTAPNASFIVKGVKGANNTLLFDASSSSDTDTPSDKLLYRWDFNYSGPNDIVYDTQFSNSSRYNGFFKTPGKHIIKLEVKDPDGKVSAAYAMVEI